MSEFINDFEILICQDSFRINDPMLVFIINDRQTILPLKEFQKWINIIVESNGDRNPKAYEVFNKFKSVFSELLYPFIDFKKKMKMSEWKWTWT